MQSWGRADTTVRLVDMGFNLEDCIEAADAYGDMERSLGYLQQNCPICVEDKPMGQVNLKYFLYWITLSVRAIPYLVSVIAG